MSTTRRCTRSPENWLADVRSGLVLVAVAVTLVVLAFQAATSPSPVAIVGTVVGPCDVRPSSTVDVLVDGEPVGSGWIVTRRWAQRCGGTISISGLDPAEEYTLDAGPLYAYVRAGSITDAMTITLRSG